MFDFAGRLEAGLEEMGIALAAEAVQRLELYFLELKKWSRKINLIAKATSDEQIVENHFLDSLSLLQLLDGEKKNHLLDIGTGAGFPALVCKAARPELQISLIEPRSKRVSFLSHIVRTLQLKGVEIHLCRVEDEAQVPSTLPVTHITARAVTDTAALLQMVERFAGAAPKVLCMKGPKWKEEVAAASGVLETSSYTFERVVDSVLPFSGAKRSIVIFGVDLKISK